ncbi:uncharacterized protein LOC127247518 [Andrographis paniculata]|uniref:uncharacterized protein LOC127247518 n=1 Tax=Andrographis paniculata TaxID=175694 RepID=UPI0021E6FE08|nr:uncharacterized protein LOC127247518 [Andrographis paniculata]
MMMMNRGLMQEGEEKPGRRMPAVLLALKRSMACESGPRDYYDPKKGKGNANVRSVVEMEKCGCGRSGCSRSIANLKDVVINRSKRHMDRPPICSPPICSPRSVGSNDLRNPITHEVVLNNSACELKITAGCVSKDFGGSCSGSAGDGGCNFVGMLRPGTPGPGRTCISPIRRANSSLSRRSPGIATIAARPRSSFGPEFPGALFCNKCGEQFLRWEAVEDHHLSKHAVTELVEGDSSRKIVEIICRASHGWGDSQWSKIERILKVHNTQKTLTQFEEYRELVKVKASKLRNKKHPRCLADGNELLRFHGAAMECNLGVKGDSSLCTSEKCRVCRILRYGFSDKKELSGGIGVFTASTSHIALESIEALEDEKNRSRKKALVVCRVIAGRVHKPLENLQKMAMAGQSGFDSLAGKVGLHSNIEELYLLSPRALLPCFVVVYKPC